MLIAVHHRCRIAAPADTQNLPVSLVPDFDAVGFPERAPPAQRRLEFHAVRELRKRIERRAIGDHQICLMENDEPGVSAYFEAAMPHGRHHGQIAQRCGAIHIRRSLRCHCCFLSPQAVHPSGNQHRRKSVAKRLRPHSKIAVRLRLFAGCDGQGTIWLHAPSHNEVPWREGAGVRPKSTARIIT
jgi:hypothetical protein